MKYRVEVVMSYWDTIEIEANNESEAKYYAVNLFDEKKMRQGDCEVTDIQLIEGE